METTSLCHPLLVDRLNSSKVSLQGGRDAVTGVPATGGAAHRRIFKVVGTSGEVSMNGPRLTADRADPRRLPHLTANTGSLVGTGPIAVSRPEPVPTEGLRAVDVSVLKRGTPDAMGPPGDGGLV